MPFWMQTEDPEYYDEDPVEEVEVEEDPEEDIEYFGA